MFLSIYQCQVFTLLQNHHWSNTTVTSTRPRYILPGPIFCQKMKLEPKIRKGQVFIDPSGKYQKYLTYFKTMQLDLFTKQPAEPETFYKVRLSNIYGRSSDDRVENYSSKKKAKQALENWKKAGTGNTGIITDFQRRSLKAW